MKTATIICFLGAIMFCSQSLTAQNDEVFKIVEEMPVYGDCATAENTKSCSDAAVLGFFAEHIAYPDSARAKGTEGVVVLRFVVEKDGSVSTPQLLKDIGDGCGEEAMRVLTLMDKWQSGKIKNEPVRVMFTLPIRFKLAVAAPPVLVKEHRFEVLNDIFCENYLADFAKKDLIVAMADDELNTENICEINGVQNSLKSIRLTRTRNDQDTVLESLDGSFSPAMREMFRNAQSGDAFGFDYVLSVQFQEGVAHEQEIYKSVIVE